MNLCTTRRNRISPFNMTPMIDVVLQLIIFFMFTSRFGQVAATLVDLPQETGEESLEETRPTLVIDIDLNGGYHIEVQPIELEDVLVIIDSEVEAYGGDPAMLDLLIRADRNAQSDALNVLARELAQRGLRSWKLATAAPAESPG